MAVALVIAAVVFAATGGFSSGSSAACGIVQSGQKLCGSDMAAYCREFDRGSLNQQTDETCALVGVDVLK